MAEHDALFHCGSRDAPEDFHTALISSRRMSGIEGGRPEDCTARARRGGQLSSTGAKESMSHVTVLEPPTAF